MALLREIDMGGVPMSYHRIDSLTLVTNKLNVICVNSVYSAQARETEIERETAGVDINTYNEEQVFETPYDPEMTVAEAYAWLKALPEFNGALDV